ncbi:MAG: hypothetical protein ABJL99_18715 [Aliishimia sp.]
MTFILGLSLSACADLDPFAGQTPEQRAASLELVADQLVAETNNDKGENISGFVIRGASRKGKALTLSAYVHDAEIAEKMQRNPEYSGGLVEASLAHSICKDATSRELLKAGYTIKSVFYSKGGSRLTDGKISSC